MTTGGCAFLFGAFFAADAMYAPVVSRFITCAVEPEAANQAYSKRSWRCPPWKPGSRPAARSHGW